ncbi:hypothetical protein [Oceaniglobus trochenteri]|uniref:hypothetical protein n=1 Tax=Oceaniglobus trochenteri TaxID=2763260 RepID=UPI001CFFFDC7|nr:hypothetical protein [Oceaniglobus trochenteri]
MRRGLAILAALGASVLFAAPSFAGGRGEITCPIGYVMRNEGGSLVCRDAGRYGVVRESVVLSTTPSAPVRPVVTAHATPRHAICGYPYRPSDSAFSGGSGYIIKDDVRRAYGC